MRRVIRGCLAAGAVCLPARAAVAQQVRGVVREHAAGIVLPGAVITMLDSAGRSLARAIADSHGAFVLPLSPKSASVHAVRIGFQPRDTPLPARSAAGGDATVDLVMDRIPPVLETVHVSSSELCPGSADRGGAFQLWEQARAGLLAAVVDREGNPAMATMLGFERTLSPSDGLVRRQVVHAQEGRTTRPFVAANEPSEFARRGYMQEDSAGRLFSAPDADVILDESFAATHCFRLRASDAAHPDQLGLAFAPVSGRDTLVDVSGVIWIDRKTPALRSLDFRFTELEPAAMRAEVGGHLEFRTMPNGVAFIERWSMRLPILQHVIVPSRRAGRSSARTRRQDRRDFRLVEIKEAGGHVVRATWPDGTKWRDRPSGLVGLVTQRTTGLPIPSVVVTIAGTADTVVTNERGEFAVAPLVPGRYTVVARDTTLSAFAGDRTASKVVDVRQGHVTLFQPQLPPISAVVAEACQGQDLPPNTATLVGRVALDDALAEGAELRATWQADFNHGGLVTPGSGPVSIEVAERQIELDERGRFIVCGVPRERPIRLHLAPPGGGSAADTTVFVDHGSLESIEWHVRPGSARGEPSSGSDSAR